MNQYTRNEEILSQESYNCAQKIVGNFCETFGIQADEGARMARSLGGGLRAGEACGALVGGLLVSGMKYGTGRGDGPEARALCDQKAAELSGRFRALFGSLSCRQLLGIDTSVGNNRQIAAEMGLFREKCPGIIMQTIELLEELGYGNSKLTREEDAE